MQKQQNKILKQQRGQPKSSSSSRSRSSSQSSLPDIPCFDLPRSGEANNKTEKATSHRIFCTWPDCDATFQYRFEWVRHEEAVHYCPYHWICCLDDSTGEFETTCFICGAYVSIPGHLKYQHIWECAGRPFRQRTFLREDQLTQHIRRVHLKPNSISCTIPKDLLVKWKIDNPTFDISALQCGFCGEQHETWTDRQNHVFRHIQNGSLKSDWMLERDSLMPE